MNGGGGGGGDVGPQTAAATIAVVDGEDGADEGTR